MGKGGGGGTTQTVQKADPWSGVQPALSQLYSGALNNYYSQNPQYYPGSTVIDQSPATQLGQGEMMNRSLQGNPLLGQAQGVTSNTLNGAYLNANPYLDQTFNQAANNVTNQYKNAVMPGITSGFAGAGRYGSNAMDTALGTSQRDLGTTLNNLATDIYGGNYAKERFYQNNAVGQAPGLANADYNDINQLLGLGGSQDAYNQSLLNADINRWDYGQNLPTQKLSTLNNLLQGSGQYAGQNSSTTTPYNRTLGGVGGALMGSQLGGSLASMFGPSLVESGMGSAGLNMLGPWGALAGGVLGLLG